VKVGIALPTAIPGVERGQVLDCAKGQAADRERLDYRRNVGVDEVVMFPASPDPKQVDLLARVAL
jgi:hypothetical protein